MDAEAQSSTSSPQTIALRRLGSAVILQAFNDSRNGDLAATRWLASNKAEIYFDFLNLPQSRILYNCGWLQWSIKHSHDPLVLLTREYLNDLYPYKAN